jgi:ubiquinone/menaquinone biosynthesis C-methylase UbiE
VTRLQSPFDPLARTYDARTRSRAQLLAKMLRDGPLSDSERLLDLGVGTGLLWTFVDYLRPEATLVGLDASWGMLRRARRRASSLSMLAQGSFNALPFKPQRFDTVVMTFAARHSPSLRSTLLATRSVLMRCGCLLIAEYTQESLRDHIALTMSYYDHVAVLIHPRALVPHYAVWSEDQLMQAASEAGFELRDIHHERMIEAEGETAVADYVMLAPPLVFDTLRLPAPARRQLRDQLLEDIRQDERLPKLIASDIGLYSLRLR